VISIKNKIAGDCGAGDFFTHLPLLVDEQFKNIIYYQSLYDLPTYSVLPYLKSFKLSHHFADIGFKKTIDSSVAISLLDAILVRKFRSDTQII
jgi:hypothetical protein